MDEFIFQIKQAVQWEEPTTLLKPENIVYKTDDNVGFVQVFQSVPVLESFYSDYEKNYNVAAHYTWLLEHPIIPMFGTYLYLGLIIVGKQHIEDRKRKMIKAENDKRKASKKPLLTDEEIKKSFNGGYDFHNFYGINVVAVWNLFLALFSIIGAIRVVPHFFYMFTFLDFKETVCLRPDAAGYGDGAAGLWVMLFTVSKLFELFDTALLVLEGKPLIFLHWYHHATVLMYTWFSYCAINPGLYFIAMNYTVHAFMYSYFFLTACFPKKTVQKYVNPNFITTIQISQMFVGVAISCFAYYYSQTDKSCGVSKKMLPWCAAMYSTYLYLFLEFFIKKLFNAATGTDNDKKRK
jgi:elongation of very long chain fatty acids protein 6